jgi:hypothetical protein
MPGGGVAAPREDFFLVLQPVAERGPLPARLSPRLLDVDPWGTRLATIPALAGRRRKERDAVLICRCAWHQRYRGYPLLNGIASWRGWTVRFTDGICEKCLERFRTEHQHYLQRRSGSASLTAASTPTEGG